MGRDPESTQPLDVLDDVPRLSAERVRRGGHVEREVVAAGRADLHGIEAQHARPVRRRIRRAGAVSVIGEDDELQAGPRGRCRDVVGRAAAVGSIGVDVEDAGNGAV